MSSPTTTQATTQAPAPALSDATAMALDRTRLAFERTTMAWVRTATSLITFGFSFYKFFDIQGHKLEKPGLIDSREFAIAMISIGILSLVFATIHNWQSMRTLRAHYRGASVPRSFAVLLAGLLSVLGVVALFAVLLRR